MAAGQGADAKVPFLAFVETADATVLGQASLGDVEVGHDLETRGNRRDQGLGQILEMPLQHPIQAVAHLQALFLRFDVDVAGAAVDRLDQDPVHQAHHRRGVGHSARGGLQILDFIDLLELAALAGQLQLIDDRAGRLHGPWGIRRWGWCGCHHRGLEAGVDVVGQGQLQRGLQPGCGQLVDQGLALGWSPVGGNRNRQQTILMAQRQAGEAAGPAQGQGAGTLEQAAVG